MIDAKFITNVFADDKKNSKKFIMHLFQFLPFCTPSWLPETDSWEDFSCQASLSGRSHTSAIFYFFFPNPEMNQPLFLIWTLFSLIYLLLAVFTTAHRFSILQTSKLLHSFQHNRMRRLEWLTFRRTSADLANSDLGLTWPTSTRPSVHPRPWCFLAPLIHCLTL